MTAYWFPYRSLQSLEEYEDSERILLLQGILSTTSWSGVLRFTPGPQHLFLSLYMYIHFNIKTYFICIYIFDLGLEPLRDSNDPDSYTLDHGATEWAATE